MLWEILCTPAVYICSGGNLWTNIDTQTDRQTDREVVRIIENNDYLAMLSYFSVILLFQFYLTERKLRGALHGAYGQ